MFDVPIKKTPSIAFTWVTIPLFAVPYGSTDYVEKTMEETDFADKISTTELI